MTKAAIPRSSTVVRRVLRQVRTVRGAATNHSAAVHVRRRVARIHPPHVRAERNGIAERVHFLVIKVVIPLRIRSERRVIPFGREHERRAAAPAAHQLRGDKLLLLARRTVLAQKLAKLHDMFLQTTIGHVTAVSREAFRLRQVRRRTVLVWVAEDELPRLQRWPRTRRHGLARPFNKRLRKPVAVTEMIVRMIERWHGV